MSILGVDVPPITHVTVWPTGPLGLNKTALVYFLATIITLAIFFIAGRKRKMVPTGVQAVAESGIDFVRDQVIMQTMGVEGLGYLPYLTTLFFFILFSNIFEIIPGFQFPANARYGVPLMLALLTWVIFNVVGVAKQGFGHYIKNSLIPPGVPKPILILVIPIEFISTFLVRPFSLSVRLFANMLAGHLILVTFATLCAALFAASITIVILPFSFALLVAMTGFEILVSFLQAFIFTILTAVYIGGAMHPEH